MDVSLYTSRAIIIVLAATMSASIGQDQTATTQNVKTQPAEAYAVYSEILRLHRIEWKWTNCAIQRESTLGNMEIACALPKRNKRRYKAEVDNFSKMTRLSIPLTAGFDTTYNCEMISEREARDAIVAMGAPPPPPTARSGSKRLRVAPPPYQQVFEFSAVGFNTSHDRAIVYMGYYCRGLCGAGALVALQKRNGNWSVDQAYEPSCSGWVS
jgi:hypothetical protein